MRAIQLLMFMITVTATAPVMASASMLQAASPDFPETPQSPTPDEGDGPFELAAGMTLIARCDHRNECQNGCGAARCESTVSICLDSQACGCGNSWVLRCDGKTVFSGAWRPAYQESPETYYVQALDSGGKDMKQFISIDAANSAGNRASHLSYQGRLYSGACAMTYSNLAQVAQLTKNGGSCR